MVRIQVAQGAPHAARSAQPDAHHKAASAIGGAAAWAGCDIAEDDDWRFRFDHEQTATLLAQVERLLPVRVRGGMEAVAGRPHGELRMPETEELFARVREQILRGRRFALIRGLPVEDLSTEECELLTWCVGTQLGVPIHQNPRRDLIVHVVDQGKDFARQEVRAYETLAELNYHSDSSDIVGLLCVRPALAGGVSTIVSATRVHDEIVARSPEAAQMLYEPWWHYNPADGSVTSRPICVRHGDDLFTHYGRRYLDLGAADPRAEPYSNAQQVALNMFDELVRDPELVLNMDFQPGDLQLLNNYTILHARTQYTDHPEPHRRRHLCRIWLVAPALAPPAEFVDIGIIPRTVAFSDDR